jgi:hypothetical protein
MAVGLEDFVVAIITLADKRRSMEENHKGFVKTVDACDPFSQGTRHVNLTCWRTFKGRHYSLVDSGVPLRHLWELVLYVLCIFTNPHLFGLPLDSFRW